MRKGRMSAIIGILSVVIIAAGFICFCKAKTSVSMEKRYQDVSEEDGEEGEPGMLTLAQKGYTLYQPLSETIQKLIDSNLFYTPDYAFYEEEHGGYMDYTDKELEQAKEDQKDEYEKMLGRLEQFGTGAYLDNSGVTTVTESWDFDLQGVLKYDKNTNRFTDSEKIATIENCGFSEFSSLMSEIEKATEKEKKWLRENGMEDWNRPTYSVYYPGVTFRLEQSSMGDFLVDLQINYSGCYIPEKYRGVIDSVTGGGKYCLYSSCVGGDKEILVFCRSNSIYHHNVYGGAFEAGKYDDKKLALIFEKGKLVDYYVATSAEGTKLDESDKEILNTYVKGTGKELPEKAVEYGEKYIYKAK